MPNKRKIIIFSAIFLLSVGLLFFRNFEARTAVWSFIQTDWSGGASVVDIAAHPGDAEGWDKYYSKDAAVKTDTPGEISLASTTADWTDEATADFAAGTLAGTAATSGKVVLLKPAGVACAAGAECLGGYCSGAGYCDTCESFEYEGQTYAVVQIGEQCWMAENLNVGIFATSTDTGSTHSDVSDNEIIEKYCYDNNEANCDTDGGLYDWNEMMGYVTTEGVQGICPAGWHLSTDNDWYILEKELALEDCPPLRSGSGCAPAGISLQINGNSNFNLPLAGRRNTNGSFSGRGSNAFIFVSSPMKNRHFTLNVTSISRGNSNESNGHTVRCVKD